MSLDLDISFGRDYLSQHFGVSYDERFFRDWRHRLAIDAAVQRGLAARFGDMGLGDPDSQGRLRLGFDDTLNVSLLLGGWWEAKQGVSWFRPGSLGDRQSILALRAPDPATTWPNTFLARQYDEAVTELGFERVIPPRPHGVLETALDLRGNALFLDFADDPELADALLRVADETIIAFQDFWLTKRGGLPWEDVPLGGCAAAMLSVAVFERFILPHYASISRYFGGGFLCACGPSSHLLASFARLGHCRYFRLGWGTDLRCARDLLGGRHIKASLDPVRVALQPPLEVRQDVLGMAKACGLEHPLSILLVHVGANMPDANIRAVYETVRELGGNLVTWPKAP